MTTGIATAVILGALVSTAYGALFHLIMGGNFRQMINYLAAAWIGFVLGHFIGQIIGFESYKLGTVYLASASIGSCILLALTRAFEAPVVSAVEQTPSDPLQL